MTALASLLLITDQALQTTVAGQTFVDHERAYPRLITLLLPTGIRGVLVASFMAAFLSTLSTQLNWGASYLLNDGYKRFLRRNASERHYLAVAKGLPFLLALGAMGVAWSNQSIGASFTWILNLTAGIGPVYLLRWFWWRINPWSEMTAMVASIPVLLIRPHLLQWLGWPAGLLPELLVMVLGTACCWLPVTWWTPPVDRTTLQRFYRTVRPPGRWPVETAAPHPERWSRSLLQWVIATAALLATTVGPLMVMVGPRGAGWWWCAAAAVAWAAVVWSLSSPSRAPSQADAVQPEVTSPGSREGRGPSNAPRQRSLRTVAAWARRPGAD